MNIHALPDLHLLDAKAALEAVTERARKLSVFGPDVRFEDPIWDLSSVKRARPSVQQTWRLYFTRQVVSRTRSMEGREPFLDDFGNFIKSMIALRELSVPRGPDTYKQLIDAARDLYERLADRQFDPAALTSEDFTAAINATAGKAIQTRQTRADRLDEIAVFINKHQLSRTRIHFKKQAYRTRRNMTGTEAQEARKAKLLSEDELDAVIAMSNEVREKGDDRDVLRASGIELLVCAPWRLNELLNVPDHCLRRGKIKDPQTGKELDAYGICHKGSKGADDTVKFFPTPMVDVGLRALADIRRITQPARDVAKWMEDHPGRAYVAEPWRLADPETLLTMLDVAKALGLGGVEASHYWLKARKVPRFQRDGRYWYRLADLESAVLSLQAKLPPGSPPLSEYLFLVFEHFFRTDMATMPAVVTVVSDAQIRTFLSSSNQQETSGKAKEKSVFERLGILDEHGNPYRVRSHAFRHYLNTIAQEGCLSQLDIARWSGRKRVEQNAAYDHTGGLHLGRHMRAMLEAKAMKGRVVATAESLPPAERDSFLKARFNTAHMTDIGACGQDWSMTPCPSYAACAGCTEHLVIKGNATHKERAERLLGEHEAMLANAKAEMDEGTFGASTWVAQHSKMVEGLRKTIAVHENQEIPDGTAVQV